MRTMKKRLGEILLERRLVNGGGLSAALAHQRTSGGVLGQVLLELRLCTPVQLLEALAHQTGVPALQLDEAVLEAARGDPRLVALVPRRLAERHRVVPLRLEGPRDSVLVVAITAPASIDALEAVRTVTNKRWVEPLLVTDEALTHALERLYGERLHGERLYGPAPGEETFSRLIERHERPVRAPPRPPVLVYGWKEAAGQALVELLRAEGHRASVAHEEQVAGADEDAVVLTPLPWLEALRRRPRARLLVAGREPHQDGVKARMFGAQGFLVAPLDERLLLREVTRLSHRAPAWGE